MSCFYESSYCGGGSGSYGGGGGGGGHSNYTGSFGSGGGGSGRNQNNMYSFGGLFVQEKIMPTGTIDYFVSDRADQVGPVPRPADHDHYRLNAGGIFGEVHTRRGL